MDAAGRKAVIPLVFALHPHGLGLESSGTEEDGVVLLLELLEGDITAKFYTVFDLDPESLDDIRFPLQKMSRHTVIGDTYGHCTAGLGEHVDDFDLVPFERQIVGAGQSGRAGSDDNDLLAGRGLGLHGRLMMMHPLVVRRNTLQHHNADRLIHQRAPTGLLAGMGADPTAHCRDRHITADGGKGLVKAPLFDFLDVGRNIDMSWTLVHAGRRQLLDIGLGRLNGTSAANIGEIIVAEVFQGVKDGDRRSHAKGAFALFEKRREIFHGLKILLLPFSGHDACQGILQHLGRPFARSAFATAVLLLDTLHILGGHGYDIGVLLHDNDTIPPHKRPYFPLVQITLGKLELEGGIFRSLAAAIVYNFSFPTGKYDLSQIDLLLDPFNNSQRGTQSLKQKEKTPLLMAPSPFYFVYSMQLNTINETAKARENLPRVEGAPAITAWNNNFFCMGLIPQTLYGIERLSRERRERRNNTPGVRRIGFEPGITPLQLEPICFYRNGRQQKIFHDHGRGRVLPLARDVNRLDHDIRNLQIFHIRKRLQDAVPVILFDKIPGGSMEIFPSQALSKIIDRRRQII